MMANSNTSLVRGLPSTMNDSQQLTLIDLLHRGSILQPNSEIVTVLKNGGKHKITHSKLKTASDKLSLALFSFGIKPGDIIGSFMWSNSKHMMLYQSLPLMGAVLHPINIRLHPSELAYIINHANDKIMFIDSDLLPIFEKIPLTYLQKIKLFVICKEVGNPNHVQINNLPLEKCIYFDKFVEKYSHSKNFISDYNYPNLTENSGAVLVFTSGTTGNPKGVLYSHRAIYLWVLQQAGVDNFAISGSDCVLAIVPLFHAAGWCQPFVSMTTGAKALLTGNVNDFTQILDMCLDEKCTVILGVPTVMQTFRHTLNSNPLKYSGLKGVLKRAFCGGSAPSDEMILWYWNNWNIEVCHAWGMTECMLGLCGKPMMRQTDVNKSIKQQIMNNSTGDKGLIILPIKYKVVNIDNMNKEIKHDGNEMGELLINGPTVTGNYFGINDEDQKHKFHNGWLRTGDICSINSNEEVILCDRSKDMIKTGGEWLSSADMENYIMSLYGVDKVCIVGVESEKFNQRPIAIIQLLKNESCSQRKIMDHLRTKYANFQLPDDILYWNEIPLTGTGKMDKKNVRKMLKNSNYILRDPPLRKILVPVQSKL
eukprot:507352_1